MSKVQIIISGPHGRMGHALCRLVQQDPNLELAGGLVSSDSTTPNETPALKTANTLKHLQPGNPSNTVLIDFTEPTATLKRLHEAADMRIPVVVGTTGFSDQQREEISTLSTRIPILLSANMSLGVNILLGVVKDLANRLADYDIEIIETHHRLKKDSPSGTALAFAEAAAEGRCVSLQDKAQHGRHGLIGERPYGEIGIHAIRGGDVVGDHTTLYAGIGERIEITHKATSRDAFASGALTAAKWIVKQPPAQYHMRDVLNLT